MYVSRCVVYDAPYVLRNRSFDTKRAPDPGCIFSKAFPGDPAFGAYREARRGCSLRLTAAHYGSSGDGLGVGDSHALVIFLSARPGSLEDAHDWRSGDHWPTTPRYGLDPTAANQVYVFTVSRRERRVSQSARWFTLLFRHPEMASFLFVTPVGRVSWIICRLPEVDSRVRLMIWRLSRYLNLSRH